jgi:hypothetical protein
MADPKKAVMTKTGLPMPNLQSVSIVDCFSEKEVKSPRPQQDIGTDRQ